MSELRNWFDNLDVDFFRPVHNKVISGFQGLLQARTTVVVLEPVTEGFPADLRADSLALWHRRHRIFREEKKIRSVRVWERTEQRPVKHEIELQNGAALDILLERPKHKVLRESPQADATLQFVDIKRWEKKT
ncbi:hypothetical protein PoB_004922700 [Plakobranchus ocellatus]|uniref:Uncharacterized protein n=1 Tax=Plakobranchus ocellatus TaxID=259542 RepID=A0AAV4BTR0_9GAST|nr:hypothetical protein PoB_004922700 [Plakobranchus ocellatus]